MTANWTRRGLLKAGAAATFGATLPMPFISRALAASGELQAPLAVRLSWLSLFWISALFTSHTKMPTGPPAWPFR